LALILDGTNTPTLGGVGYGDGSELAFTGAGSAGGVLYSAGSSAPVFSAAGTAGQVLTSAGASAPTWSAPATSGLVFISSQTVSTSVASVDFTSGINSTYDDYEIVFENLSAATAGGLPGIRLYQSGSYSTSYASGYWFIITGSVSSSSTANAAARIELVGGSTTTTATKSNGVIQLLNVNNATARIPAVLSTAGSLGNTTAQWAITLSQGASTTAAVVSGFQILMDVGNISSGTIRLYGRAKS
jgi:hypothetical protein